MSGKIEVIGLGAGDLNQLPLGIYKRIIRSGHLFVRTENHPVIEDLKKEAVTVTGFDTIYESHEHFEPVYREIVETLIQKAQEQDILYAVPGHPHVAEQTVKLLIEKGQTSGVEVDVVGGRSFLDDVFGALHIDPIEGFLFVDAFDLDVDTLTLDKHLVICQVYDNLTASEVKLSLLEHLPADYRVKILTNAGLADETVQTVALHEMDHDFSTNNLTCVYVPPVHNEQLVYHTFGKLRKVIRRLRAPDGCPWDRKQTHESLKKYLLEEAYEVLGAIDDQDDEHLAEELGDVLLQVMLHAQIGEDNGYFTIDDVIQGLNEKMIRRHPHVFGDQTAENADEVKANWDEIKRQEKGEDSRKSILDGVDKVFPALMRAYELQKKAAKVGFDWPDIESVWKKVDEELEEIKAAEGEQIAAELGDALFALVNLARRLKVQPAVALEQTNQKFYKRFSYIESQADKNDEDINTLSLDKMDQYWEAAKKNFKEKKDIDV